MVRSGLVSAVLVVSAAGLAGCSEDAPTNASTDDFCGVYTSVKDARTGEDFQRFADDLEEVGTPSDISEDGRSGFTVMVRVGRSLEPDATLDELVDPDVSDREAQQLQAFFEYASETCESLDDATGAL